MEVVSTRQAEINAYASLRSQELYRMGILYNDNDSDGAQDEDVNAVLCNVPVEQPFPMFVMRHGKTRRSRRCSVWQPLPPLYLSFAGLSDDADIQRLLSPSILAIPTIQHREPSLPLPNPVSSDIPLSLPASPAFESLDGFDFDSPEPDERQEDNPISISNSILHKLNQVTQGDWTFVDISQHNNTPISTTPCSEPETWELVDDS